MDLDCLSCGACCKIILLLITERSDVEFYKARGFPIVDGYAVVKNRCPMLEGDNKCAIYAKRPLACAAFKKGGKLCLISRKAMRYL